ncbi:MAG: hypothetical protein Kow0099_38520 [Candidatus Abyssubacteria bacterium]
MGDVKEHDNLSLTIHVSSAATELGQPPTIGGEGEVVRVEGASQALSAREVRGVAVHMKKELAVSF